MAAETSTGPRRRTGLRLLAVALVVAPALALWTAPSARAPGRVVCMPADPLTTRKDAFKVTVVYRLGPGPGRAPAWKPRTTIPTLASFETFRDYAVRFQLDIEAWLYSNRARLPLEACEGRWRPAVRDLAFDWPRRRFLRWLSRRRLLTVGCGPWNGPRGPGASTSPPA